MFTILRRSIKVVKLTLYHASAVSASGPYLESPSSRSRAQ